ncbi:hypothetical protein PVK06_042440 [Gossypium arboreum]|uniref:Uncharacterized protein n=1 Tax=Gossypium arboreum TaxID=29729 RepID=A0ABR0MKQ1_GOSAR|nr:hypothetical protein PVK06_042440 [Gossypium arboreum]
MNSTQEAMIVLDKDELEEVQDPLIKSPQSKRKRREDVAGLMAKIKKMERDLAKWDKEL